MTRIVAHRGGAIPWPENSLTAFRNAVALGVEEVECDVHLSADGVPVVVHDPTLERTTEARGPVAARTAAELAALRLRGAGGECVPLLSALAALLAPTRTNLRLELKDGAEGAPPARALEAALVALDVHGMRGRTTLIAFHGPTAAEAARVAGLGGAAWLIEAALVRRLGPGAVVAAARAMGVQALGPQHSAVDAAFVQAAAQSGLALHPWTANTEKDIRWLLEAGVASLTTDDPALALRLRGSAMR